MWDYLFWKMLKKKVHNFDDRKRMLSIMFFEAHCEIHRGENAATKAKAFLEECYLVLNFFDTASYKTLKIISKEALKGLYK